MFIKEVFLLERILENKEKVKEILQKSDELIKKIDKMKIVSHAAPGNTILIGRFAGTEQSNAFFSVEPYAVDNNSIVAFLMTFTGE